MRENLDGMPILKLEIEGMKFAVCRALMSHHEEVLSGVERELDNAIATFPFQEIVRSELHAAIKRSIEDYFKYGDGATKVKEAVWESLSCEKEA